MKACDLQEHVKAFHAYNQSRGLAPKTITNYKGILRRFREWFVCEYGEEAEITARRIRECVAFRLAKGKAPSSVRLWVDVLKALYSFLVLDEVIAEDQNPMRRVKPPKVPASEIQPLTPQQIQSFLNAFDREKLCGYRDYVICLLILDTGLRAGEVLGLDVGDVNFEQHSIRVRGKGNKVRTVYMGQRMRNALEKYIENTRPSKAEWKPILFPCVGPKYSGERLRRAHLSEVVRRKFDQAEIERSNSSAHRLRHTFAVNFLRRGGGVFHLQKLLGHSTLTMTRRYVMLADGDLQEAHRKASPVDALEF